MVFIRREWKASTKWHLFLYLGLWQILWLGFSYPISMRYKVHVDETATVLHEGCCDTDYGATHSFTEKRLQPLCLTVVSVSISIPIHANIHTFPLAHDSHVQLKYTTQHRMNRTNGCCSLRSAHKLLNQYNLSFSQMVQNLGCCLSKYTQRMGRGGSGVHHKRRWKCLEPICVGTNILLRSVILEGRWSSFSINFIGKIVQNAEIHEQHSALSKVLFSMWVEVEGRWDGCESVTSKSELMSAQAGTVVISDMPESRFLKVLY